MSRESEDRARGAAVVRGVTLAAGAAFLGWAVLPDLWERRRRVNLRRGPADSALVALTFDDGPHPELTPRVLDTLAAAGATATFFMIGEAARRHPDVVRRVVAEGHALGVHTYSHHHAWLLGPEAGRREVRRGLEAVREAAGGARPLWFRPPYGAFNARTRTEATALGLRVALWSCDAGDWLPGATAPAISRRVRRGLRPGAIIDLHDGGRTPRGCRAMVESLPGLLTDIAGRGLSARHLGALCGVPPVG